MALIKPGTWIRLLKDVEMFKRGEKGFLLGYKEKCEDPDSGFGGVEFDRQAGHDCASCQKTLIRPPKPYSYACWIPPDCMEPASGPDVSEEPIPLSQDY